MFENLQERMERLSGLYFALRINLGDIDLEHIVKDFAVYKTKSNIQTGEYNK